MAAPEFGATRAVTAAASCLLVLAMLFGKCDAGFVTRSGSQLMLDGNPFYFLGANAYWLQDAEKDQVDNFFAYAEAYGLKVIRLWAFNSKLPEAWGSYDASQFEHLDYIIYSAGLKNIKLILALGNTWSAYRSPEDMLRMAGVDPESTDILGFYGSGQLASFYRDHASAVVKRMNTFSGIAYADDPTIMTWNVINEPRCPGCASSDDQQVHLAWLSSMANHLKGLAPNQLIAYGTEGYFGGSDYDNIPGNPGAGGSCEGEDWTAITKISSVDVGVVHVYWRQMESIPPTWEKCDFECYCSFYLQYIARHASILENEIGKPLVVEEFNIISHEFSKEQRAAFFQLAYDQLLQSQASGAPLAGLMFWGAGIGNSVWDDGYTVYLDGYGVDIHSPAAGSKGPSPGEDDGDAGQGGEDDGSVPSSPPDQERGPTYVNEEGLDRFRRGAQRAACAEEQAKTWLPDWSMRSVDAWGYLSRTSGKEVQQIIRDNAAQVNDAAA